MAKDLSYALQNAADMVGATKATSKALPRIEQPAKISGIGNDRPVPTLHSERGAYMVPLQKETT
jgi:hypothetical protein